MKIVSSLSAAVAGSMLLSSVAGAAPLSKMQVAKYLGEEALTRAATLGMAVVGTVATPIYATIGVGFYAWHQAHDMKVSAADDLEAVRHWVVDTKMLYGATFTRYGLDADGEPENADLQLLPWTYDVKGGWGWDGLRQARTNGGDSNSRLSSPDNGDANTGFHH